MKRAVCGFCAAIFLLAACCAASTEEAPTEGSDAAQAQMPRQTLVELFFSTLGGYQKPAPSPGTDTLNRGAQRPEAASPGMTAQQWIRGFLSAASTRGLALEESFVYEPGMYTGQHSYGITIAETPAYIIGLSVFSEDGVAVSSCSMRLTSGMLRSDELVQASDVLWRAAQAMIAASDPEVPQEDMEAFCEALCPDLPAALLRREEVDAAQELRGARYSLWAGFEEDAFFGDTSVPSNGYIVDFVAQFSAPEETERADGCETRTPEMPQVTLDWYAAFERAAGKIGLALPGGFVYREVMDQSLGMDVCGELKISSSVLVRVTLGEALDPYRVDVVLDTQAESLATDCERFVLAMYAVIQVVDPTLDGAEAITLAKQLSLRIGDGKASVTRTSLRGVAYELTVEPAAMRACFRTVPAIAAYRDGED